MISKKNKYSDFWKSVAQASKEVIKRPPWKRGNLMNKLSQTKEEFQKKLHDPSKKASVCVVFKDGQILGVSRKDNLKDMGLPGGKVDPGESPEEACIRELKEETGLDGEIVRHLYTGYEDEYLVNCYLVNATGELSSSEEGLARFCEPLELLQGSFKDYNEKILKILTDLGLF